MSRIGGVLGTNTDETQRAVQTATPALLSGLADRVEQPGGPEAVMNMLDASDRSPQMAGAASIDGDAGFGTSMLDGIFGSDRGGLLSSLSGRAGVGSGVMGKLLPMLAPMVMGVLAKRRAADGLNGAGLSSLLAGERTNLQRNGLLSDGITGRSARAGTAVKERTAVATPQKPSGGGMRWLGWLIGAIVLLAVAAWALSQCGGGDDLTDAATGAADAVGDAADDATDAAGDVVDDATDAAGDAADEVTDAADDAADAAGDAADDAADALTGADLQPDVDAALTASGVAGIAGVIDDDGVVTLTGEADSEDAKAAAEAAAAGVEGVESVDNQITVAEAEADDSEEDENDESAAPASGSTINDLLDLAPITFAVNSADITPEGQAVLADAVAFMETNPDVAVEIGGHTDSDGDDASNLALSQARADSVKAFLEGEGIDGARMTTKGYGEAEPKVENDTPDNKAINRRIEFTIQ